MYPLLSQVTKQCHHKDLAQGNFLPKKKLALCFDTFKWLVLVVVVVFDESESRGYNFVLSGSVVFSSSDVTTAGGFLFLLRWLLGLFLWLL